MGSGDSAVLFSHESFTIAIIDKKSIFSPGLCLSRWSSGGRCWGSTASASCCSLRTWPRSSPAWWVQRHGCNKMTLMTTYRSNVWYKSLWSCLCNKMEDSWLAESLPWENGNVLPTFKTRNSVQTFFYLIPNLVSLFTTWVSNPVDVETWRRLGPGPCRSDILDTG